jgi:AraC-like DNA-binding protein
MPSGQCARIVATARHRIRTLTVRQDALILVLKGRKQLLNADNRIEAGPGHSVLIAAGTAWDVVNDPLGDGRYEALALSFDAEQIEAFHRQHPERPSPVLGGAQTLPVDEELNEAVRRTLPRQPLSDTVLQHRMLEVLMLLSERGIAFAPVATLSWSERIRRLVAHRPHADWRVGAIADTFHMSESSLRRRLEDGGQTLSALVREVRLETALGLLQTTTLPVGEVAQRCGWESHSRFSAAFQERWGFLPSVLRERAKTETA